MAELLGKRTGCSKGKGSSMHFTDPRVGLLGENAIVGAGVPIAAGAALRAQLDKTGQVAMTVFGDGALNQGALLEAFNLAAVWKLPARHRLREQPLFRNDARSRHGRRTTAWSTGRQDSASRRSWLTVTILSRCSRRRRRRSRTARQGEGPQFIEAMTYRLVGHMVGDSEPYRTKEEVAEWRGRGPDQSLPAAPGRGVRRVAGSGRRGDRCGRSRDRRDRALRRGEPLARAGRGI